MVGILKLKLQFKLKFALLLPYLGQFVSQTLPPCCPSKQVGGIKYTLAMVGDTSAEGCVDPCIYRTLESPGKNICFKKGNLPSKCNPDLTCKKVITRQNVSSDMIIRDFDAFNKALAKMKKDTKWKGFMDIGSYHGLPYRCSEDQHFAGVENGCCINHWGQLARTENFVTWHRLFTYNMEHSLNQNSDGALAMPYWDWTSPPNSILKLPWLARQGEWTNGPKPGGVTHRQFRPRSTDFYRGLVKTAFTKAYTPTYIQFNIQIVQPHNAIHGAVGGDMGAPDYASYDPIFYLHHSYVDLQFAYYQELQRLRHQPVTKNSFSSTAQSAHLQPFASKSVNPYDASRLNNIGYQTLDYELKFCYNFSQLLFEGLTPAEFHKREQQEMEHPSILAGVAMNTTGYPSTLGFDLVSPTSGSLAAGAFFSLGQNLDNFSQYTSFSLIYFDFTDILSDSATVSLDTSVKVKVTNITNAAPESAYQPVVVFRPAGSSQLTYRIHTDDITQYAPVMHGQPGAKVQFLDGTGNRTTDTILEYINNADGIEVGIPISVGEDQEMKYNEHKYHHSSKGTNITLGYAQYFWCDASGDAHPQGDVTVVQWDRTSSSQIVRIQVSQTLLLAWCHGCLANVNEVSKDDYDDCTNLDATNARYGPASYHMNTDTLGTFYFANGVAGACQDGWKITVEVWSHY